MKIGIRVPSLKKRIAARTSVKRAIRQNLGVKAPRDMGWVTNPRRAAYNRVYNRTTKGCGFVLTLVLVFVLSTMVLSACASKVTGEDVVAAFKGAGLEAESTRSMTKEDYGLAPYVCTGTRFLIPSLGPDNGGRIFICDNEEDRDALSNYYIEMGKSSAMFFSWVFVKGDVVVQINGDLPEDIALKYEAAIP